VGVHNTEYEVAPSQASAASQSVAVPKPEEAPQIVSSRRHDVSTDDDLMMVVIGTWWQVYRVVGPCAYYMGIIDFQQKWNFSKKVNSFVTAACKCCLLMG